MHIFNEASIKLIKTIVIKNHEYSPLKIKINLYIPNTAAFTSTPLKKIEKPVFASTWVLLNQK
jgi:hypothetical protein